MMLVGTMANGSTCSKCRKDISGQFGVELNGKDFCKSCADEIFKAKENGHEVQTKTQK